jgi:phospholipid/cholesterol/gamma-HCH transport system substrate-binding protein
MLIERSQAIIGAIAVLVIGAGSVFAVGATAGMFEPGDVIRAELTDAAGIESGDFVFVAGHRAGRVQDVAFADAGAEVTFTLTAPEIPADSTVDVIISNTLGRRALQVTPGTSSQVLADGDLVPVERTGTPVDLPELGDRSAELLGEVDADALQELTTALADVTEGAEEDVAALLEGLEDVSAIVSDRRDEIAQVLEHAETVVDAAADKDAEIVAIIDDFGHVLDRLVQRRGDITRLLQETAASSTAGADLIEEQRAQIDAVLAELHQDLRIVDDHQVDLAHSLMALSAGFEGFASIGYSGGEAQTDNPTWGNVFTTGLGSIGVGALLECNGAIDVLLTGLLGPDPRCERIEPGENPTPSDGPPREDPGGDVVELPPIEPDRLLDSLLRGGTTGETLSSFLSGPGGER